MTKTLISRQARVLTRTIVSGFGQLQLVMVMARTATEPAEGTLIPLSHCPLIKQLGKVHTDQQMYKDYV